MKRPSIPPLSPFSPSASPPSPPTFPFPRCLSHPSSRLPHRPCQRHCFPLQSRCQALRLSGREGGGGLSRHRHLRLFPGPGAISICCLPSILSSLLPSFPPVFLLHFSGILCLPPLPWPTEVGHGCLPTSTPSLPSPLSPSFHSHPSGGNDGDEGLRGEKGGLMVLADTFSQASREKWGGRRERWEDERWGIV